MVIEGHTRKGMFLTLLLPERLNRVRPVRSHQAG